MEKCAPPKVLRKFSKRVMRGRSDDDADSCSGDTDNETVEITGTVKIVHIIPTSSIEGNEIVLVQINGITTKL